MATEFGNFYRCIPPLSISNSFALETVPERAYWAGDRPLRLHWFSQTIGPGRGLELIFSALRECRLEVELHLRGDLPERYCLWLERQTQSVHKQHLVYHPRLSPADLASSLQVFDVGLSLESPSSRSRALTSTNKIFQYLEAGLPVLATDTPGQREVLERLPGSGWLISSGPEAISEIGHWLQELFAQPEQLTAAARVARNLPATQMGWRSQRLRIIEAAHQVLAPSLIVASSRGC